MKRNARRIMRIVIAVILVWVVIAQSCMQFRISDEKAILDSGKRGVLLTAHTETINGHHLHWVSTGHDSLPALVFVHGSPGSWNVFESYLRDSDMLKHFRMVSIDRPGFDTASMEKRRTWIRNQPSFLPYYIP